MEYQTNLSRDTRESMAGIQPDIAKLFNRSRDLMSGFILVPAKDLDNFFSTGQT